MQNKLCFLVCENFRDELQSVIESERFDDAVIVTFPADCSHLHKQEKVISDALRECGQQYNQVCLLGGCCVAGSEKPDLNRSLGTQCFYLIQSQSIIDTYLAQGCYLLTPGWLEHWRDYLNDWGFDQETACQFFKESASRLVLLDTGTRGCTSETLKEFADFIGLPFEVVPVGLDFFRLVITKSLMDWRLNNALTKPSNGSRSADYAMALDLVGALTRTVGEKEAAENIFNLFASLFAPKTLVYLSVNDGVFGEVQFRGEESFDIEATRDRLAKFAEASAWTESGSGFIVRIGESSSVLGVIELDGIAFPEHRERYLNLALALNPVCCMAINNARTYERLEKARETLRVSEQRWATTLASIGDAVIATDTGGRITYMNVVAVELTGWTFLEAVDKPITDIFKIINENTRQGVADPVSRVLKENVIVGLANHTTLVRKDGTEVPIDDSAAPIKDQNGVVKGVVLVFRSIVERRRAEEVLRASEKRYRSFIEVTGELGWTTNAEGEVVEDIPSFRGFTGQSYEEVKGWGWSKALHPDDLDRTTRVWKKAVDEKTRYETEYRLRRWDGVYRYFLARGVPIFTEDREIQEWVGTCIDITERKQSESLKDEFIGLVSHELRTPLTVIIGALSVTTTPGISEKDSRELLADAVDQANALAEMVENLLELSRHQANRLKLTTESVNIEKIAHMVVEKLRHESTKHRLTTDFPAGIPGVLGDKIRVERVLYNLVHNAIKYSPNGGEVKITARRLDDTLVVGVTDHGVGISTENQERLFQSFERINTRDTRNIGGVGLGLRVCRILVEAQGGRIWVESEPGKGSTFYFTLPCV